MVQENARTNPISGISFMLHQVQTTLSVYEEYKSVEQQYLKTLYQLLAFDRERNADNLEWEEHKFKKQTDIARDLFLVLDLRIDFLKGILRHYEYVLEGYAKSGMFSRFENLESFLSGCNSPFPLLYTNSVEICLF
jgi:hypothetical protein